MSAQATAMSAEDGKRRTFLPMPIALLVGAALIVGTTMWGWLHWRADLGHDGPPMRFVSFVAPLFALLWTGAIIGAARIDKSGEAHKAAKLALQVHVPFTFIVLMTPLAGIWVALLAAVSAYAVFASGQRSLGLALVGVPYVAWLAAAAFMSVAHISAFAPNHFLI